MACFETCRNRQSTVLKTHQTEYYSVLKPVYRMCFLKFVGMINPETLYSEQIAFYVGDKVKAWKSLNKCTQSKIIHLKPKPSKNIEKRQYVKQCWVITENNKHLLSDIDKRCFKQYDIDHIVPISYGYKHNISATLIGSIDNLRIMPNKDNLNKGTSITKEAIELLNKWGLNEI